ncbi:hypothetical protein [Sorangium sp. So ce204]|uniref:hypothetical protein n=1 Tax=Sorangium sp. So ce204 TaxID=3133288 RepID=UPI003F61919A
MGNEFEFVRHVSIPGDRYKVVIGDPQDEVVVAESLPIGPAEKLVVDLRRVVGGHLDVYIQNWCREYKANHSDVIEYAPDDAVDIVDDYVKRRKAQFSKRPFGKCCQATVSEIKSTLRTSR